MNKKAFDVKPDGKVYPVIITQGTVKPEVPPGLYSVNYDGDIGAFYLNPEKPFTIEGKIYGNVNKSVDRYLRSYELNDRNLGVVLEGFAGSGKTLTAKALAIKAIEMGMIVIIVNTPYYGQDFINFLNSFEQSAMVFFDEFEKVYNDPDRPNIQTTILTLLDGTATSYKKLYTFTINDRTAISQYLTARPGRVRYNQKFTGFTPDAMQEFLQENLQGVNDRIMAQFMLVFFYLSGANGAMYRTFDILREVVREMNQHKESLSTVLTWMNGTEVFSTLVKFHVRAGDSYHLEHGRVINTKEDSQIRVAGSLDAYARNFDFVTADLHFSFPDISDAKSEDDIEKARREAAAITLTEAEFVSFNKANPALGVYHGLELIYKKDDVYYQVRIEGTPMPLSLGGTLIETPGSMASMPWGNPSLSGQVALSAKHMEPRKFSNSSVSGAHAEGSRPYPY